MNNLNRWYYEAKQLLQEKGLATNSVNLICEKVYGVDYQTSLLSGTLEYDVQLDLLLKQVLACKEPLAYIIGFEYFYGRKYYVDNRVLIPRIETENLLYLSIEKIKNQFPQNQKLKVLDLCTGSGIIGITLFKELELEYDIELVLSDISFAALEVCQKNVDLHNVPCRLLQSDLFDKITEKFDVILTNPPYVPHSQSLGIMVGENEPHVALFADDNGLAIYEKISREYQKYVAKNYFIGIEIGDNQANAVMEMMKRSDNHVTMKYDMFERERNVFVWSENGL